jgi:hypothetical protein
MNLRFAIFDLRLTPFYTRPRRCFRDSRMTWRGTTILPHPDPLPLGEGTAADCLVYSHDHPANPVARFFPRLTPILPLPAGEGQGEGERHDSLLASNYTCAIE